MNLDPVSIGQRVLLLIAIFAFCWIFDKFGRPVLLGGALVLFLLGHWGWALVALFFWHVLETGHRRFMAEERAAGFYNGSWVD